ncbi:aldose 1-epimerase family protein [Collinsella sp. AGMB00827]|uniref:Aldose 1-epimerase family protein n=1 Tax=Collinsella ureilytica TaxID=2869515 RepID=A0ABS7MJT2_9ACTN|nr:aldose 1-epimerase family protein [Collinsella urealyticum]MBY4797628.1 aldose 1-epimerase family protein [Collinsella urealyticum]
MLTTITHEALSASIDSAGAQLMSLSLHGDEFLWQRDPAYWAKTAPNLFPNAGAPGFDVLRSAVGECRLPKHGFARDYEHELIRTAPDGTSVTFELTDRAETREIFPYCFSLQTTYELKGASSLAQTFVVENRSDTPMPCSVGGHPAFNVPIPGDGGKAFEDYEIAFEQPWSATSPKMIEGGIMSYADPFEVLTDSDALPLTRPLFAYDTVMLADVPKNTVTLKSRQGGRAIRMEFPGFGFIGIWSMAPDAPFVALEPWMTHAALDTDDDVLEHREGMMVLNPDEKKSVTFTITIV